MNCVSPPTFVIKLGFHCLALCAVGATLLSTEAKGAAAPAPREVELIAREVKVSKNAGKEEKRAAQLRKKLIAIAGGGDINAVDKNGQTALMYAAAINNRAAACWLVAKGADVTLKSKAGKTAEEYAKDDTLRELLQTCAELSAPLSEADREQLNKAFKGNLPASGKLSAHTTREFSLRQLGLALRSRMEWDASLSLFASGQCRIALLLRSGAVNLADADAEGRPLILDEASTQEDATLLSALGLKPQNEASELLMLTLSDDTAAVQKLLTRKPELARTHLADHQPIIWFAQSADMLQTFCKAGADINEKVSPFSLATVLKRQPHLLAQSKAHSIWDRAITDQRSADYMLALKKAGAASPDDATIRDMMYTINQKLYVYNKSADAAYAHSFIGLIQAGANLECTGLCGSMLHAAVELDSPEAVKAVLAAGIDPNLNSPNNALYYARGKLEVIDILLQAGCDPSMKTNDIVRWVENGKKTEKALTVLDRMLYNIQREDLTPEAALHALRKCADKFSKEELSDLLGSALMASPWSLMTKGISWNASVKESNAPMIQLINAFLDAGASPQSVAASTREDFPTASCLIGYASLDAGLCKRLLSLGEDPKFNHSSPLRLAISPEVVDALLKAGAEREALQDTLKKAVSEQNAPLIEHLKKLGVQN